MTDHIPKYTITVIIKILKKNDDDDDDDDGSDSECRTLFNPNEKFLTCGRISR